MKRLIITLVIVFAALVVAGFLIFGNDIQDQQDNGSNPGAQTGGANESPENNTQTQPSAGESQPQTYNIEIKGYAFGPSTLNINVGDTIIWTNKDSTQHTVTSDSGGELASPYLSNGNNYSHRFTQAGTFSYHCRPHPYMKGRIIVE